MGVQSHHGLTSENADAVKKEILKIRNLTNTAVPELGSLFIPGAGLGAIGVAAWRKRK